MNARMKLVKAKSEAVVDLGNVAFVDHIKTELIHHTRDGDDENSDGSHESLNRS